MALFEKLEKAAEELPKCQTDWAHLLPRLAAFMLILWFIMFLAWTVWRFYLRHKQCRLCGRAFVDLSKELENADLLLPSDEDYGDEYVNTAFSIMAYLRLKKMIPDGPLLEKREFKRTVQMVSEIIAADWHNSKKLELGGEKKQ